MKTKNTARQAVISYLSKHKTGTQDSIVKASGKTPASVTQALAVLKNEGVVANTGESRNKYRVVTLVAQQRSEEITPPEPNGDAKTTRTTIIPKGARAKVLTTVRMNNALDVLLPDGLKNVDTHLLLQWIDLTKELIGG